MAPFLPVHEDLFTPSIKAPTATGRRPWSVAALVYPAVFGGPLAGALIALVNGRRLGIGRWGQAIVGGAFLVTMAVRTWVLVLVDAYRFSEQLVGVGRVVGAASGVLLFGVVSRVQRLPFRAFVLRGGEPSSLFWPGLAAVVAAAVVDAVLTVAIVGPLVSSTVGSVR